MAQSPLLIDEVSCVKEEFNEMIFGEVSSTSCDIYVQLITPQVGYISQQLFYCDASGGVATVKPVVLKGIIRYSDYSFAMVIFGCFKSNGIFVFLFKALLYPL